MDAGQPGQRHPPGGWRTSDRATPRVTSGPEGPPSVEVRGRHAPAAREGDTSAPFDDLAPAPRGRFTRSVQFGTPTRGVTFRVRAVAVRELWRESVMPAGTVKWFNAEKGFGFISPDDGGPDVHVEAAVLGSTGWFLAREPIGLLRCHRCHRWPAGAPGHGRHRDVSRPSLPCASRPAHPRAGRRPTDFVGGPSRNFAART
ncbi:cold-shock protein [Streptomyces sp. NPDC048445]|uniref:cold-shock protein n=1 Tax=Streptomyces sp. NPDC048445 TaxID=3365553 RepID=UPI003715149D